MTDERDAGLAPRKAERVDRPGPIHFVDAAFVHWRVMERDASADPGSHAERCLVFSCTESTRRVWEYPTHWRTLSDVELTSLSWAR